MIYHKNKIQQDVGATAVEYGLIASLISVLAVSGMSAVGMNLSNTYCTVSKYLGGSGTCSGATSSSADSNGSTGGSNSTSGNSSNGSSTGSVNSTNSYADGATLYQIMSGLNDDLDLDYVPSSMEGSYDGYLTQNAKDVLGVASVFAVSHALIGINTKDPITNVFGVYDNSKDTPITDYNQVNDALQEGGDNIRFEYNTGFTVPMEVTTASGKVYTVSSDGSIKENTK